MADVDTSQQELVNKGDFAKSERESTANSSNFQAKYNVSAQ